MMENREFHQMTVKIPIFSICLEKNNAGAHKKYKNFLDIYLQLI